MHSQRRKRRAYNQPGHAHELTFSCYQKFKFLKADRTNRWLAEAIEQMRGKLDVALWAYVFMPDHVHLVIYPRRPSYSVSEILRAIKEPVSRQAVTFLTEHAPDWLSRITHGRGQKTERHFWQPGGGFDRNIVEPTTLRAMIDYIHLNPVRRRLAERPTDWLWSSASWFEGSGNNSLIPDRIPPEWA